MLQDMSPWYSQTHLKEEIWLLPLITTQIEKIHWHHEGPTCVFSWDTRGLPLMGHTSVCNNFPCGAHMFCLSKYPHGAHVEPLCVRHRITHLSPMCDYLFWWCQCRLLLMGPTTVCKIFSLKHPHHMWSKRKPNWSAIARPHPGRSTGDHKGPPNWRTVKSCARYVW